MSRTTSTGAVFVMMAGLLAGGLWALSEALDNTTAVSSSGTLDEVETLLSSGGEMIGFVLIILAAMWILAYADIV